MKSQNDGGRRIGDRRLALIVFVFAFCFAHLCAAFDITTKDGHSYRQCTIAKVEPDALRISHSDGVARIAYENLPSDFQKQYFDPSKVAEFRRQVSTSNEAKEAVARAESDSKRQAANEAEERARDEETAKNQAHARELRNAAWDEAFWHGVGYCIAGVIGAGSLALYFLPSAIGRGKENGRAIFLLNLFTGWSGVGWIAAFIWAAVSPRISRDA